MRRKKNKKKRFIIIGIAYFSILLVVSIAYSFFNTNLSINATTRITKDENYDVETIIVNKWENNGKIYYHFTPTITYKGTTKTIKWKLFVSIPYDTEIIGCYSSKCSIEGEVLTIENESYNGILTPSSNSTSFGIQLSTSTNNYEFKVLGLTFYTTDLQDIKTENDNNNDTDTTKNLTLEEANYINPIFKITGGWNTTTTYILKVENTSSTEEIISWNADITYPPNSQLESCWGGTYNYDNTTGTISLSSPDWIPTLKPNSSIEINIFMNTRQEVPYTPTVGKFIGITANNKKIEKEITIGA